MDEQQAVDETQARIRELHEAFVVLGRTQDNEARMIAHMLEDTYQISDGLKLVIGEAAMHYVLDDRESSNSVLLRNFERDVLEAREEAKRKQSLVRESLGPLRKIAEKWQRRG